MTPRYIDSNLAKAQFTGNFQDSYSPSEAKAMLDEVPTADVAPVIHAHWILICNGKNEDTFRNYTFRYMYKCSDCGRVERIYTEEPIQNISDFYPHCHCGAKMDEGVKNNA